MARTSKSRDRTRPVRQWLWLIAALVAAMVLVGGATRLTGSGLSITEWQPISGVLPPLHEAEWLSEFDKYRAIPQFLLVNPGMTLAEFKFIYRWEWTHRILGRLIGVVFFVPFIYFLWRGRIGRTLAWKLGAIFMLGGIQGAIGWWMVQSGLAGGVDVSQFRLAVHLTLACVILAAVIAVAASLAPSSGRGNAPWSIRAGAIILLAFVFLQIFLGALVAKTGAGRTYNTWPLFDGRFIPALDQLSALVPAWKNFFENVLTVQFNHRMAAYLLFLLAGLHAFDAQRTGPLAVAVRAAVLFALVTGQAMLGVLTLLHQAPTGLALAHQAGALVVLVAATLHLHKVPKYHMYK